VNEHDVHLLSNGIRLDQSRFITVSGARFERPQYKGEGGNGYHFVLMGNDCLLRDSEGIAGRHNFSFAFMHSSGNVVLRFHARDGRLPSDFHQKLSPANLIDNAIVDGDALEAKERSCCDHGHSATESVFCRGDYGFAAGTAQTQGTSTQWPPATGAAGVSILTDTTTIEAVALYREQTTPCATVYR
jgi:hypothetical protein